MLKRLVVVTLLVVAGGALGFTLAGGNPVDAVVDSSSGHVGGSFGTARIANATFELHVNEPSFGHFTVTAPDGWSETRVIFNEGTYDITRPKAFPSGEYTIEAIDENTEGDLVVVERHNVTLQAGD